MNPVLDLEYIVLFSCLVLFAGGYTAWYSSADITAKRRKWILGFRLTAIVLCAIIALNLGQWKKTRKQHTPKWCVLLDRSLSMDVTDTGEKRTRWQKARKTAELLYALSSENQQIDLHTFSDKLEPLKEASALDPAKPDGRTTDISGAVDAVLNRYVDAGNLRAIFLLSDGLQITPEKNNRPALRSLSQNVPIYSICYGGKIQHKDLSLMPERRQQIAFSGDTVRIKALLVNSHLGHMVVNVQLLDSDAKILQQKRVAVGQNRTEEVIFELKSEAPGYYEYRLKAPQWKGEHISANNEASIGITVLDEKIRILAIEGTPHWDSKFLIQHLRSLPYIDLTSIYRVSSERFFRIEANSSKPSESPVSVFPDSLSEIAQYDLVLFGKGVDYFLTSSRIKLLKEYLSEFGGGILFVRSKPYFGNFPELEPLEPVKWGQSLSRKIRWQPTLEGEESGIFGKMLPHGDQPVWQRLPLVTKAFQCPEVQTFSQVLVAGITQTDDYTNIPVLISRRYGKGLIVALNSEGLWQWDFFPDSEEIHELYKRFWMRLIQWTATHGDYLPGQDFSMRLNTNYTNPDEPVRAIIRERSGLPLSKDPVLQIWREKRLIQTIRPRKAHDKNQWDAIISQNMPGTYQIKMLAHMPDGEKALSSMLLINALPDEMDDLSADPKVLERISKLSGGCMTSPEECPRFLKTNPPDEAIAPAENAEWASSWDKGLLLSLILACFCAEWYVRRRNGLL